MSRYTPLSRECGKIYYRKRVAAEVKGQIGNGPIYRIILLTDDNVRIHETRSV